VNPKHVAQLVVFTLARCDRFHSETAINLQETLTSPLRVICIEEGCEILVNIYNREGCVECFSASESLV
jgi:hypothetical protein